LAMSYAKLLKFGEVSDLDKGQRTYLRNLLLENASEEDESDCDEFEEGMPIIDESGFVITEGSEFKEKMELTIVNFEGEATRIDENFLRETRDKENGMLTPSYAPSRSPQPQSIPGSKRTVQSKRELDEKKAMREFVRKVTMVGAPDLHPTLGGSLNSGLGGVGTKRDSMTG
jgi:hypothetical protein